MVSGRSNAANLEELRLQLSGNVALALVVASSFLLWITLLLWTVLPVSFPSRQVGLLSIMLTLAVFAWRRRATQPNLSRHLVVWGPTAMLLVAMAVLPAPWLPFLGLVAGFLGAVLIPGSGPIASSVVAVWAAALAHGGWRDYPTFALFGTLAFGIVVTWLMARAFYTALQWAWSTQQRADDLLELARDRQQSLSRVLKSLDQANTLLLHTQRDLIIARQRAEEARLVKEQFAANVSHELRTPLSIILGFSEVMCLSSEVYGPLDWPPALRQDVYQIYRNSRHLLSMIDDVLDLSRVESTGFTLNIAPVSLEPLVRDTVEIMGYLFRDRPVSLEVEVAPDLPVLQLDRTRIRQVLLNLLNNAARFTEKGQVRVTALLVGQEVVVSVRDTGTGIPADRLPHVFDEFYQVDRSLDRRHSGAGLGLAISKHFVEAHDGRIWAESQEDVGSLFSFALPVPDLCAAALRPRIVRPMELPQGERLSPVLLVDSDPRLAEMVQPHVGHRDVVHVTHARSLARAVRLHRPAAVVYNVRPGEHAKVNAFVAGSVPVVECSLPSAAWVKNDLAVIGYLKKPITRERLLREIRSVGDVHRVLVIDDERGFCQLVERILSSNPAIQEVHAAYGGKTGLRAARTQQPDLVLLDLMMPDLDGLQVLEAMRRDPCLASVPVILLTVTSHIEDQLAGIGGEVVIRSPGGIRPADTLRYIGTLLPLMEPRYDEQAALEDARALADPDRRSRA